MTATVRELGGHFFLFIKSIDSPPENGYTRNSKRRCPSNTLALSQYLRRDWRPCKYWSAAPTTPRFIRRRRRFGVVAVHLRCEIILKRNDRNCARVGRSFLFVRLIEYFPTDKETAFPISSMGKAVFLFKAG